jgi:cytochrome P450
MKPPRPSGSSVRHTIRFFQDPLRLLEDARRECGDVFSLRIFGMGKWIFLTAPEALKEMYQAPTDVLDAGEIRHSVVGFMFGDDALSNLDGEPHRKRQRLLFPHLNGKDIYRHVERIRQVTLDEISEWTTGKSFSLLPRAHWISLESLFQLIFDRQDDGERGGELMKLYWNYVNKAARSPFASIPFLRVNLGSYSPYGRILQLQREVRREFRREIERYRREVSGSSSRCMLQALLSSEEENGGRLTDETILDELLNLLFAGHETTGSVMTWTIEQILSRPEIYERVMAEIDSVLGGEPIAQERHLKLPYLEATIHETMRFRPIAPFGAFRQAQRSFKLQEYDIPKGEILAEALYTMSQRADLFPEPHQFDPERFYKNKPRHHLWNPFGGGSRACVGRGFALLEAKCVLATLFQVAQLRLVSTKTKIVREGLFFAPEHGLQVVLEERRLP